jgi:hypothetical protein
MSRIGEIGGMLAKQSADTQIRQPSPLENLKQRREYLAQQLADHDAAIAALEANPEVTKVIELLAKVGSY